MRISYTLNQAACYLKLKDFSMAVECCDEVLGYDAKCVKALFRRGEAYRNLGKLRAAKADLVSAAKIAPKDAKIRRELQKLQQTSKDGAAFAGVFVS